MGKRLEKVAAILQGSYFLVTGIWPLVHRTSFEFVTGPKQDYWLVETVGLLTSAMGLSLISSYQYGIGFPTIFLALSSAGAFLVIDVVFVHLGIISSVYLFDAIPEVAFILLWSITLWKRKNRRIG